VNNSISYTNPTFSWEYNLTDHLGNVRAVIAPAATAGYSTLLQQTHYYPGGMAMSQISTTAGSTNNYLYNGKELQTSFNLNWYDYGARFYDPALGRWHSPDPLAERRIGWSPYAYCLNNPILRIDPNGLTDFTFDKKTGAVSQVGEKNDDPDRILRTNRKGEVKYKKNGEARVAVGGIEQGILKDGQNWKTEDQVVNVGGEGQPSLGGVEDFVTKMSEYVGVEVSGAYLSNKDGANADISKVYIDEYSGNTSEKAGTSLFKLYTDESLKDMRTTTHFHTHLTNIGKSRLDIERPSGIAGPGGDLKFRDNQKKYFYNFLILTRTATYPTEVQKIPYTNWQK
jgi:RHS repeat-associated protein